jgi:hypothetical protein
MFCFNGCSFTYGEGFNEAERLKYTYPQLVGNYYDTKVENISVKGSSNYLTFMRSAEAIQSNKFDVVFTQWTALNRLWLFPGPDASFFTNDTEETPYDYREIHLSKGNKKTFVNTLLMLNGEFQNILDLVSHCQILDSLAKINNTRNYYINGLLPWTDDLFHVDSYDNMYYNFSTYTKQLLDFENRDDGELMSLHRFLSSCLKTLNQKSWVNMFDSINENIVDHTPANHHPGVITNKWVTNKIIKYIGK